MKAHKNMILSWYLYRTTKEFCDFCEIWLQTAAGRKLGVGFIWEVIAAGRKTALEEIF